MMTTFHVIHIIVGAWLAIVNSFPVFSPAGLATNNIILGVVVALYNLYFLLKGNVDVRSPER